jgi:hypothetical protein
LSSCLTKRDRDVLSLESGEVGQARLFEEVIMEVSPSTLQRLNGALRLCEKRIPTFGEFTGRNGMTTAPEAHFGGVARPHPVRCLACRARARAQLEYKAMEKAQDGAEFRWWREGDQFSKEIERMDALLAELAKCAADEAPEGFRLLCSNPFWKFCSRVVFNPDDTGLFSGIYLPLDLWRSLHASGRLKGPQGGNVLSFRNVEEVEDHDLTATLDRPSLRFDDDRKFPDDWLDLDEVVEP